MACQEVQLWNLSGLIAAFLDLAIAYVLLCASAVVYFATKFLGLFGLNWLCLRDGIFFDIPSKSFCLRRLLVDFPIQKVSHVVLSVEHNSPFQSSTTKSQNYGTIGGDNGILEMEGEASCSSVSDARRSADVVGMEFDMKGKGVSSHRPRSRLHRHRKGSNPGKASVAMVYDPPIQEEDHFSTNKEGNRLIGGCQMVADNDAGVHYLEYDNSVSRTMGVQQKAVTSAEMNHLLEEDMLLKQNSLSNVELQNNRPRIRSSDGDEKVTIKRLEWKLEEERAARAALQIELEEERSAAAIAADEAMAMILRLQEEKASIEMEARQYQRILEEKSIYDAEEMSILKEILIRRETEKHFLEKEVEAYMQMISVGNGILEGEDSDKSDCRLLELTGKNAFENEPAFEIQNERSFVKQQGDSDKHCAQMSVGNDVGYTDLHEKEIASVDKSFQLSSKDPQVCIACVPIEEHEKIQEQNSDRSLTEKITAACNGTETSHLSGMKQQAKDADRGFRNSCDLVTEKDCQVHDVHIDGNIGVSQQLLVGSSSKDRERYTVPFEASAMKRVDVIADRPSSSGKKPDHDVRTITSDITHKLPPIGRRSLPSLSGLRQSSMSPLDCEMLKINSEVGWLQERLKLIQEGKQKLSFSVQNQERDNIQLKLLEDIARQVQELRQLTEPGKVVRQVSLPLPPTKVSSKKRRSRSVSAELQISSEEISNNAKQCVERAEKAVWS